MIEKLKTYSLIPIGHKWKIHLLFFAVLLCALWGGYFPLFITAYTIALLHELAHVGTAKLLGVSIASIEIYPFGLCARLSEPIIRSPLKEACIAAAGPMMNLLIWAVLPFLPISRELLPYADAVTLSMAILNLLPCLPLDGGRILKSILTASFGILKAYNYMLKQSRALILLLLCGAVAYLFIAPFNFSLLMIGAFLLGNLYCEQKNISLIALREILYHRQKIDRGAVRKSTVLTVHKDTPARCILKLLTYNRFYIIQIVDDDENILSTITESRILRALINKNIRISMGEV